jgi:hypothetical protein
MPTMALPTHSLALVTELNKDSDVLSGFIAFKILFCPFIEGIKDQYGFDRLVAVVYDDVKYVHITHMAYPIPSGH